MHNLHLIVAKAKNAKEAMSKAENTIEGWGDENNWRTVCGCVCEDGTCLSSGEGRWSIGEEESKTIASINDMVKKWIRADIGDSDDPKMFDTGKDQYLEALERVTQYYKTRDKSALKDGHYFDLYLIEKLMKNLQDSFNIDLETFNLFERGYKEWQLDECGVTHIFRDGEPGRFYVVFIDMHS